jgi:hypothetical protein
MMVSGFTLVRNAVELDFPVVESIRSLLPWCEEVVVNVGRSEDDTLELVRSIGDPRIRILETVWDPTHGESVLRDETLRAMRACRHSWGIYIQADEVLHERGGRALLETIEQVDPDPRIEGIAVRYRHLFGDPFTEAVHRHWYRREVRAVRLDAGLAIHPFRDAQGFRVGPNERPIRARLADAEMFHYGYARSAAALRGRARSDRWLYPGRRRDEGHDGALLQWFPGIRPFRGDHPEVARGWVERHRHDPARRIARAGLRAGHLRAYLSAAIERWTGWRPFEFRNYRLV